MSADVNDGTIEETKKMLRDHLDPYIKARVKEAQEFLKGFDSKES